MRRRVGRCGSCWAASAGRHMSRRPRRRGHPARRAPLRVQQGQQACGPISALTTAHDLLYESLSDREIAAALAGKASTFLIRGRISTLLARREIGGLLFAFARRHPRDRAAFEALAERAVRMRYDEARRHVQLWTGWPRCYSVLVALGDAAHRAGHPPRIPGLRKLLKLAGITAPRGSAVAAVSPPELPRQPALPHDIAGLQRMVRELQASERQLRGELATLRGELDYANQRIQLLRREGLELRRRIRQTPNIR